MAQSKIGGWLGGGLFLLVGLGLCIGGLWSWVHTRNFVARALHADGEIVALVTHYDSDGDTYSPVFRFTDTAGVQHEVQSKSSSRPALFDVGEKVTVLYEADDPAAAKIDSFSQLWLLPTILAPFGLIFALLGAGALGLLGRGKRLASGGGQAGSAQELTPRPPPAADGSPGAGDGENSLATDAANPFARTDGPVRKSADRDREHGGGGFGSGAKYD